ncbi:hypothetical protein M316_0044 [Nitrincola phage 1M3-16]|uniref:DNA helicase n=1 Tax=Nitrincola phage 1M3-16 TaxID=1472912 RepID=UPI000444BBA1|nr:DNA helicase [Nitrincola phage 1M3-16]AHX01109.1 hypothetical protein M316_0044 [Nitrincola phage 1M3-16]
MSLIHKTAIKMWADKINPHTDVLVGFDGVLKLWQLSQPKLNYDIIYVDEAQDTNPCVLDIIQRQSCKIIYVGDQYQSIYQFRGAVNAMEIITAPSKTLTKSFRYGEKIAAAAKWIISGAIDVKGSEHIDSKVGEIDQSKPFTKIYRLNSTLFYDAVDYVQQGRSVYCEVDIKKFINMLWSAYFLYKGDLKKVKDEDIALYSSWAELMEEAKEGGELKRVA